MPDDFNFIVGGEAGQGVQSLGFLLAKVFVRGGYHVFADQDYESRVRGGHNFFRVRVKKGEVSAISETVDMLIALNDETIERHRGELSAKGAAVFNNEKSTFGGDKRFFGLPLEKLAKENVGNIVMSNTVALGAALALVDYPFDNIAKVITEFFSNGKVALDNVAAAKAGYDYIRSQPRGDFPQSLAPLAEAKRMLINGNEALALGALAAGCKFMSAYPMTPATSIMQYLAAQEKKFGLVMVHVEDEIAAVNMAIGASYAGVRAMTATSGSGFCLMVEGLGLAGITETPLVIVNAQRPGPACGLPTRTEQGDLQFVLHAHHGEFPRAVLAPATAASAFWTAVKAFNWADKYQLPVVILTDHHLASSYYTVEPFDLAGVTIDRGLLYAEEESAGAYQRHALTKSGVSPRAFPGLSKSLVVTDSDEHDEWGHLTEDANMRTEQVRKRMRKLVSLHQDIAPPLRYGPEGAEITLVGWGSTYGAIHEAFSILQKEGASINMLHLEDLWPFPTEPVFDTLSRAKKSICIESNATGQLARLIRTETGLKPSCDILRYDGRPITPAYIAAAVRKECR